MRVKSEIWVHSYIRTLFGEGAAAFVVRRGDSDAGAIFVRINRLDGTSHLFGPAPAGFDELDGGRGWVPVIGAAAQLDIEVEDYLREEMRMDPDIWIIEVEDRQGRHFLDAWLVG